MTNDLRALLKEMRDALYQSWSLVPEGRAYLARIDAALAAPAGNDAKVLPIVPWNGGWAIRPTHEAANAFWKYWEENGVTHKHGYYESTWGAINRALAAAIAAGSKHD